MDMDLPGIGLLSTSRGDRYPEVEHVTQWDPANCSLIDQEESSSYFRNKLDGFDRFEGTDDPLTIGWICAMRFGLVNYG